MAGGSAVAAAELLEAEQAESSQQHKSAAGKNILAGLVMVSRYY
jgi:hypothetical protein